MPESRRAVYYATDDNLSCIYRLRKSIQSLRQFNPKIPVYVAYFGDLHQDSREFFDKHNVTLIYNPEGCSPLLAKFLILENDFPESELVYLDTDTIVFGDIEELFTETGPQDFHAREAPLCKRDGYPYRKGAGISVLFKGIVNYELFDSLCKTLGVKRMLPVFNLGIMVFKNGFHSRFWAQFDQLNLLVTMFRTKQLPYPCASPYVSREIAAPLALAGIPNFTWSFLEPSLAPFYIEYRANDTGTGVVMHVLNRFRAYSNFTLQLHRRGE